MNKKSLASLSFQIMTIIIFGLLITGIIQYVYSRTVIQESILNGTKKQAYIYLLGVERQIQSLPDPFDKEVLQDIFHNAFIHDIDNLDFAIINVYMFDQSGRVIAYLYEPETLLKDLKSYYGKTINTQTPYLGEIIEDHHVDEHGQKIPSTDIITPVHFNGNVIGGVEVEIDLKKTFALIEKMSNRYEFQTTAMLCSTIILLLGFIWITLNFRLIKPVQRIAKVTEKISGGNFKARVDLDSTNEIGLLARSVNTMAHRLEKLFQELDETYMGTLNSLTKALEAKDDYTASHSANVTRYSIALGQQLGLSQMELDTLKQGAMHHDLGKIGIPDDILNKSDELSSIEREIIEQHSPLTSTILAPLEKFKHFSDIARYHHERWDGNGYPDGLAGEDIPLLARIVSITDTWDAMTSDRVYRKGMNDEEALRVLEQERNSGQWDPYLVDQFVTLVRNNNLSELQPVKIAA